MNKTFKVVFNRARQGLMVANEITSSVQKKGTKTVLAAAAASLMASGIALAADSPAVFTWTNTESLPNASYSVEFSKNHQASDKNYSAVIEAKESAKGSLSGVKITANAAVSKLGDATSSGQHPQFKGIFLRDGVDVTLEGDSLDITMTTDTIGGGDNSISGISTQVNDTKNNDSTKLTISAKTVTVNSTSTAKNGKSVYAIDTYGGVINFTGNTVKLTTSTYTERDATANQYSETASLVVGTYGKTSSVTRGASKVTFSDSTSLVVNVTSNSEEATTVTSDKKSDRSGGSPAFGVKVDGGTLDAKGSTKLTVNSNGANATGLQLATTYYSSTTDSQNFSSSATVNNLTATATSQKGKAYGVRVLGSDSKSANLSLTGDSLNVTAAGISDSRAIQASGRSQITVNTDAVNVKSSDKGIIAVGKSVGTKIDITTKELTVNAVYGIWLQNNTEDAKAPDKATSITIRAEKTSIDAKTNGFVVFSNGQLTVNSNLSVKAPNAIDVRGNSTANINIDRKHTTILNGDVVFETPNSPGDLPNSGKIINANVNLVLAGKESYWEGCSYQEYKIDSEYKKLVGLKGDASYHGNVTGFSLTIADGAKWTLTGDSFVNTLTLEGGTIDATKATTFNVGTYENNTTKAGFTVQGTGSKLILGEKTTLGGSIILKKGAELETSLATAYTGATIDSGALKLIDTKARLTFVEDETNGTGTLVISDAFTYSDKEKLTTLKKLYSAVTLNLANATYNGTEPTALIDGVIQSTATVAVEATETGGNTTATIGGTTSGETGAVTTGAQTIKLDKDAAVTVAESSNVTLVGKTDGSAFIDKATGVTVGGKATLNLGSVTTKTQTSGVLPALTLSAADDSGNAAKLNVTNSVVTTDSLTAGKNAVVTVTNADLTSKGALAIGDAATLSVNNASVTTSEFTGASSAKITLGSSEAAGSLHTEKLKLNGAMIFLDPAWQNGTTIADASFMSVGTVEADSLSGTIVAGQNSIVVLGATKTEAVAGFNRLSQYNSMTWGENGITAALYIGQPITISTDNTNPKKILVDGTLTAAPNSVTDNAVRVNSKGLLMVDQAAIGSNTAINGTLLLANGSYIGLVNSVEGNLTLATTVTKDTDAKVSVVTDNPFVKATLSNNIITSKVDTKEGLRALASTGLQAMTRRADSILAQTIADRTSVDQELAAGANLWVDVAGETYEADKLDNGASFKADMGYGAFGAEFGIGDTATAGAAIQYGKGSLRSSVYSIKNSIDSYGATIYGTMKFGESKVVADIAYVKNTNDITSSQTALNQKPDTQMYSIGVRGQHHFTAGNFQIVPSVGVRVSRLETDSMAIGSVKVKKQKQNIVQVPIALRINGVTQNAAGWAISPSFKVAYVPTFGDKEITALGADQTVIDTSPVQADFGIHAQKGNLMLNANFMAGTGNDGASSIGGKVGLKYVF